MNKKYISLVVVSVLLTACGGGEKSSTQNDGKGSIDLKQYFPNKSMTKTFSSVERDGDNVDTSHNDEIIEVVGNTITTTVGTQVLKKVVFSDTNITTTSFDAEDGDEVESKYRHVDLGDKLLSKKINSSSNTDLGKITTKLDRVCKIQSKENRFEKSDHVYTGDLLKIECIAEGEVIYDIKQAILDAGAATDLNGSHSVYNKSYTYVQKDIGEVASIDDDCVSNAKLPMIVNDNAKPEECIKEQYDYQFYLP